MVLPKCLFLFKMEPLSGSCVLVCVHVYEGVYELVGF